MNPLGFIYIYHIVNEEFRCGVNSDYSKNKEGIQLKSRHCIM